MKRSSLVQEVSKTLLIGIFGLMLLVMLIPGIIAICCLSLYEKI